MDEKIAVEEDPPPEAGVADRLRSSEMARCRVVHEQYRLAAALLRERVCERIAAGVAQDRWQQGVAAEIGLALHIAPSTAAKFLARAVELEKYLPHLRARLYDGDLSPEAIPTVIAGLSHLDVADRRAADERLCSDPAVLAGLGLKQIAARVQQVAYDLDAQGTVDRIAVAEKDRTVTIRPLPDGMARVSLLLPVSQGVGVYAALRRRADALIGVGVDVRTRGQIMADTAFERLTGRAAVEGQPVLVNLTLPATVLLSDEPGTGHLDGGGAVPAEIVRNLVGRATAAGVAWVKRLFIAPDSGAVAMDSRQRCFPDGLAEMIRARDRYCRTPFCDAPIAHSDHVFAHAKGGPTSFENGQGLCAACNYAKEAEGWTSTVVPDPSGRHTVETRTPSGHVHRSTAPDQAA